MASFDVHCARHEKSNYLYFWTVFLREKFGNNYTPVLFYATVVYARKRTCASVVHQAGSRSRLLSSGETEFLVGESMFKYVWFVYEQ